MPAEAMADASPNDTFPSPSLSNSPHLEYSELASYQDPFASSCSPVLAARGLAQGPRATVPAPTIGVYEESYQTPPLPTYLLPQCEAYRAVPLDREKSAVSSASSSSSSWTAVAEKSESYSECSRYCEYSQPIILPTILAHTHKQHDFIDGRAWDTRPSIVRSIWPAGVPAFGPSTIAHSEEDTCYQMYPQRSYTDPEYISTCPDN